MATPDAKLVERLDGVLTQDLGPGGRLGKIKRYLDGDHPDPYMPRSASAEYKHLARRAITNWLPLISDTYAKSLFVDGLRAKRAAENSPAWEWWQANGLDARQGIVHRGALEYGVAYGLVLPGDKAPVMRPVSALTGAAWYADDDDEFPELALRRKGTTARGDRLVELYDATSVYTFGLNADSGDGWRLVRTDEHGLGVTPWVRWRDRLDGEARGVIAPFLPVQDRINEITFALLIALQYSSHRQRWATGLAIPEDADGNPVEPFKVAVDRLWTAEDPDVKFGDFAQTEVSGHLQAYESAVRTLAGLAQISPNILTGDLVNLSAEAMAQLQDGTQRKLGEYETNFGESWESYFRLAAVAAGQPDAVGQDAQVRWRDTEARSLAQTVDALGKLAQMLQVPVEALWERVPGVTEKDVENWRALKDSGDVLGALVGDVARQTTPTPAAAAIDAAAAA
jgi:hypothetical protein